MPLPHGFTARARDLLTGPVVVLLCVLASSRCTVFCPRCPVPPPPSPPTEFSVDAGGRPISALQSGSSLHVRGTRLRPLTTYEFRLGVDGAAGSLEEAVSFARATTDIHGAIEPFVLWYESGVVGCSQRLAAGERLPPYTFRTFDEAERALAGRRLTVSIHPVLSEETGRLPNLQALTGGPEVLFELPVANRQSPMVYPSDGQGCLLNSQTPGDDDVFVSGRNFPPGERLAISMVPNQRAWFVGDRIVDVTGRGGTPAPDTVLVGQDGRFTARIWDRSDQFRGAFDIVAHRVTRDTASFHTVARDDIISFAAETAFLLSLRWPIGGPTMDIAGRPLSGSPYFEFADSFADDGDPVWGAVDPTFVPVGHPGGRYAAYYVVAHRDVNGWDPAAGGATNLVDVSGGIEIMPVKSSCINGTDVVIWPAPLTLGEYDVVVDFGASPAENQSDYMTDANYDATLDFLDGADQVGFVVAEDPYAFGPFPVGEDSYSQDDFFTIGSRPNVDLRAVVRFPATTAGVGTPVAAGAHPLFLIEHGNHRTCEVPGFDGDPAYDANHTGCPSRTPNHMGYMGLLERLASHGVIAVSIDAYDLTGWVPQLIPERSDLILKHIELWSHMNDVTTFPTYPDFFAGRFAGHVDLSRISVSGHSRGGEASVGAYMRNMTFSIESVSSIAPVDGQAYVLPDVPYFVILPAADGDVVNLNGARIYDRAGSGLTPVDASTKSGLYVYGANHNFFNTVWASHGDDYAWISTTRDDYIPAADQQRLGEAYLAAFARVHLKGETVYEDMLRGRLTFPSTAGFKQFPIRHETSHSRFESGGAGGAPGGGAIETSVAGPSVHTTQAVRVAWSSSSATYTYSVPAAQANAAAFEVLSFRVAQTNSGSNPSGDQNFQVELVGGGNVKAVYASRFGKIPKPYTHGLGPRNVLTTIRIPLASFIMNRSGVALDNIDTIRFRFTGPSSGEIYVDDIEFSR